MKEFFIVLHVIVEILKLLPDFITAGEKLFPEKGQGVVKLELLKSAILQTISVTEGVNNPQFIFDAVWKSINPVVNSLVAKYTADGTFAKG